MALKRLFTGEMVSLSSPWIKPDHPDRKLLASIPATAGLLPQIDEAHRSLLASQPTLTPERVTVIQEEQKYLDIRHDNVLRGCYLLPEALAYLTKDRALAAKLTNLQKVLLPEGLLATQKSYREEAGQASLLKSRLSDEDVALLKQIKTADGTLWDAVKEWEQLARKLEQLEDERDGSPQTNAIAPSDAVRARNKWIRTVNAMRSVLELVGADQPGIAAMLNRITEAERRAERRGAGSADKPAEDGAPAETEDDVTETGSQSN
jgi:hypothetical protein